MLSGCAGVKHYEDRSLKNIEAVIEKEQGSVFSGTDASIEIYSVDKSCKLTYLGVVENQQSRFDFGLDEDKMAYVHFVFQSSGLFSNNSSMSYGSLLKPRKGYRYQLKASYIEGIYNLEIFEKRKGRKPRQLETYHFEACKQFKS